MKVRAPWLFAWLCATSGVASTCLLASVFMPAGEVTSSLCWFLVLLLAAMMVAAVLYSSRDGQFDDDPINRLWNRLFLGVAVGGSMALSSCLGLVVALLFLGQYVTLFANAQGETVFMMIVIGVPFSVGTAGLVAPPVAPTRYTTGDDVWLSLVACLLGALAGVWVESALAVSVYFPGLEWSRAVLLSIGGGIVAGIGVALFLGERAHRAG